MEIATRNVIFSGSVGLAQAHPQTKPLAMGDGLPPDLVHSRSTLPIRALVLAAVPAGTDNPNRTKLGSITPPTR